MDPATAVRDRLVEAATRLFADQGYESTSVQEVVELAGVTKGSMYHYFKSKDDLLFEIYGRVLRMQTDRLERLAAGPGRAVDRLRAVAVDVIVTSVEHLAEVTVFFRSMHLLEPDTRQVVRGRRRHYHERFRELVEQGQRDGQLRADVDPDLAVHFFFGTVHHLQTWYRHDGPMNASQVANTFTQVFLDGLLVRP